MGWLTMRDAGRFPNARAYLDDQFTYAGDDHRLTVLKSSMVGSTYYAAAERIETASQARSVFAIVCLTFWRPNARDGQTFGYKHMTEHMGPNESECPASILDLLTPIEGEWPNDWRARCRANLTKRRLLDAKPTPRPGQTIVFDTPLSFTDGIERTRFEVIAGPKGKGLRFRDPDLGLVCKIPAVNKRAYRLINPVLSILREAT